MEVVGACTREVAEGRRRTLSYPYFVIAHLKIIDVLGTNAPFGAVFGAGQMRLLNMREIVALIQESAETGQRRGSRSRGRHKVELEDIITIEVAGRSECGQW